MRRRYPRRDESARLRAGWFRWPRCGAGASGRWPWPRPIRLDKVRGLELLDVGVEEELELFAGFGREHDGLGGEAVADAVAGRLGSAFRGGRGRGTWRRWRGRISF